MSIASVDRRKVLGLGAGLTLCGASALAKPARSDWFDWKLHRPEEVGMSAAGLQGVRAAIQKHIDNNALPGAVTAIARRNKLVWYEAQGVSQVETHQPLRKDDLFRMMSATKPVTAVAVLQLAEAGALSLDDKVSRFIPSFSNPKVAIAPEGWQRQMADPAARAKVISQITFAPAQRELTIKDLLTHTNGLGTFGAGDLAAPVARLPNESLADYCVRLGSKPLDFQPGSRFSYSPLEAFDVLLRIVEIASGVPADVFVRERILQPLGMTDTFFSVPPDKQSRLVGLYERKDDAWRVLPSYFDYRATTYVSGAGGLVSSARDYLQFEQMLLNRGTLNGRRVLKEASVALMASNQVGDLYLKAIPGLPALTAGQGFGLGVAVTLDPAAANTGRGRGAFGWPGAYGVNAWADPELDLTAVFFVQNPFIPATHVADAEFEKAIRAAIVS